MVPRGSKLDRLRRSIIEASKQSPAGSPHGADRAADLAGDRRPLSGCDPLPRRSARSPRPAVARDPSRGGGGPRRRARGRFHGGRGGAGRSAMAGSRSGWDTLSYASRPRDWPGVPPCSPGLRRRQDDRERGDRQDAGARPGRRGPQRHIRHRRRPRDRPGPGDALRFPDQDRGRDVALRPPAADGPARRHRVLEDRRPEAVPPAS